jgi:glycosyltransferase involved in cell wall biosynthesis
MTVSGHSATGRRRVLIVAHGAHDDGGMERAMAELIRRAHREYEFVLVATDLAPDLEPLVDWRRVRVLRRPRPLRFVLFFVLAGIRAARIRADLVHTLGALVPNRAHVATVQFCHAGYRKAAQAGADASRPPLRRLNASIARALGLAAEWWSYGRGRIPVLAAVSDGVAAELRDHYPSVRVAVTPNGVDVDRFRPDSQAREELRSAEGVQGDTTVAVFVGSDWDHKGLQIALEAVARARVAGAAELVLWVVGRGDQERFSAEAARLGIASNVRFFGFRRDAERFYQAADIFLFPSAYETFSLVSFEAAACGLPIVATRLNGVEELIGVNEAGGIIVERTAEAFAEALTSLAADPLLRRAIGDVARRRASHFTWDRSARSVIHIYAELLDGSHETRAAA